PGHRRVDEGADHLRREELHGDAAKQREGEEGDLAPLSLKVAAQELPVRHGMTLPRAIRRYAGKRIPGYHVLRELARERCSGRVKEECAVYNEREGLPSCRGDRQAREPMGGVLGCSGTRLLRCFS